MRRRLSFGGGIVRNTAGQAGKDDYVRSAQIFTISDESFDSMVDYDYICKQYSNSQANSLEAFLDEEYSAQSECTVNIVYGEKGFYAESVEVCLIGSYGDLAYEIYEYLEQADYINITVYERSG